MNRALWNSIEAYLSDEGFRRGTAGFPYLQCLIYLSFFYPQATLAELYKESQRQGIWRRVPRRRPPNIQTLYNDILYAIRLCGKRCSVKRYISHAVEEIAARERIDLSGVRENMGE